MAGVYIIFQYVDSLVNRTSPIYFPCYCFDLFLIMRLFLHVPRLLKKNLNAEGKSFTAVVLGVLGEQLLHHCIQCQHQMQLFECKVKERSQKACDCEVKKPLKVFFFCEYLLLLHSNQGRDCKKKSFNTNVSLTRKSSKDIQATSVTLVHRLGTIFQPGLNEDNKNLKNLLDKNT